MNTSRIAFIIPIILFVLVSSTLQAQETTVKKEYLTSNVKYANKYLERGEPYEALKYFAKETDENPENHYASYQLGELYYQLFEYKQSQRFYGNVVNKGGLDDFPLARYWYGVTLKMNGDYVKAKKILTDFIENFSPTSTQESIYVDKAKLEYEGARIAMKEMKKKERNYRFEVLDRPANTNSDEYGPTLINDSVFVMSTDRKGVMQDIKDKENGILYTDNYRVRYVKEKGKWIADKKLKVLAKSNTYKSDGPGCFTKDGRKYYYTNCSNVEDGCEIYVSTKTRNGWSDGVKLNANINAPQSENKQPFIVPTGDTLFFVSERADGMGMQDIWFSVKKGGEDWGPAKNLGPNINTPFIDMSPAYYPEEKTLFFASDGRSGFGGMDMYMAKGKNFEFVKDLGMPFNSSRNDFYLVLGEQRGFFSSDRIEGGMGKTDIYTFVYPSKRDFIRLVATEYVNDFKEYAALTRLNYDGDPNNIAVNVPVKLVDGNGNVLKTIQTDAQGFARFEKIPTDKNYRIVIDSEDPRLQADMKYFIDDIEIVDNLSLVYKDDMPVAKLEMERKGSEFSFSDFKGFALIGKMKAESNPEDPAIGVPLVLLNDEGEVVKKIRTNTRGMMRFENLASDKNYTVVIDTEDPSYDPSMKVVFEGLELKRYDQVAENVKFENIYFGFGSKEIDPESAKVLDKLADYYLANPTIQIDISAFTDTVGNEEFNKKLSEDRANAVLNYLREKKIDESSLVLYPMGEDKSAAPQPEPSSDDKGNRYSRRVEFFIVQSPEDQKLGSK